MPSTGSALRRPLPAPRATGSRPDPSDGGPSVDAALRRLPSHGWTAGWVGRRDRALLVLSQRAGLSFADLATLTVDDIVVHDGVATIRTEGASPATLRLTEDGMLCGPCALSRWLHALGLAAAQIDGRVVASVIARSAPLTPHSPHVCEGTTPDAGPAGSPVFPADDRWATAPTTRPSLPAPTRPTHDLHTRTTYGTRRPGVAAHTRADVARIDGSPTTVDHPTALANRADALLSGSA